MTIIASCFAAGLLLGWRMGRSKRLHCLQHGHLPLSIDVTMDGDKYVQHNLCRRCGKEWQE